MNQLKEPYEHIKRALRSCQNSRMNLRDDCHEPFWKAQWVRQKSPMNLLQTLCESVKKATHICPKSHVNLPRKSYTFVKNIMYVRSKSSIYWDMCGVSCVVCHVLCVVCCVSCVVCHVLCVMCCVSCVMCCVSCVVCHVLCVMCCVLCVFEINISVKKALWQAPLRRLSQKSAESPHKSPISLQKSPLTCGACRKRVRRFRIRARYLCIYIHMYICLCMYVYICPKRLCIYMYIYMGKYIYLWTRPVSPTKKPYTSCGKCTLHVFIRAQYLCKRAP